MSRSPQLDILRGVAVLLVVLYHSTPFAGFGWIGVDLFFVLSGFLIAGLLFREINATARIRLGRFYIRRAFRIYPPFYFLLMVIALTNSKYLHGGQFWAEVLFVQNYRPNLLIHTWSLAVEEHFYLFLPVIIIMLRTIDRLRTVPLISLVVILVCLLLRLWTAHPGVAIEKVTFPTHLRIDTLLIGVTLAYWYNCQREIWDQLGRSWLPLLGLFLLLPSLVLPRTSIFVVTFGLTLNGLGFAALLISILRQSELRLRSLEQIGVFSYSIYLWHPIVLAFFSSSRWRLPLAIILCPSIGIAMAIFLENPPSLFGIDFFLSGVHQKSFIPRGSP